MENYIVRVYRRDDQKPDEVIGTVERVEMNDKHPFKSLLELCEILSLSPATCKREARVAFDQSAHITPAAGFLQNR